MTMEMFFSGIGTAVTVLTAVISVGVWLYENRKKQLRIDDVLVWSNQCIETLQEIRLYCELEALRATDTDFSKIRQLAVGASILVEKGRLFFRNKETDGYGRHKEPAYRGYRPLILEKLVLAHRIAIRWQTSSEEERIIMRDLAPKFYPVLSSFPALGVTGFGAKLSILRSAKARRGAKLLANSTGVFHPSCECGRF